MMTREKPTVKIVIASKKDGARLERNWKELSEQERDIAARDLTKRFLSAAGYRSDGSVQ